MNCPKCKTEDHCKDGKVNGGKQRYKCRVCDCRFTQSHRGMPLSVKLFALKLYLEGSGFRAIGRLINVSAVSVLVWIRKFGEQVEKQGTNLKELCKVVEMDEVYAFIGKKNEKRGYGQPSTDAKSRLSAV